MENTSGHTALRKPLRPDPCYQGSETGPAQSLKKQTRQRPTQASVSQARKGPANGAWPAHHSGGLALALNSQRKKAIHYTHCPLHYGGCRSSTRRKRRVVVTGASLDQLDGKLFLVQVTSMRLCQRQAHILYVCVCYLSTAHPAPTKTCP